MDARIRWITHKGKKILVNDYTGLAGTELLTQVELCVAFTLACREKDYGLLVSVRDAEVTTASQVKFAEAAKRIRGAQRKVAVIGLNPLKKMILNAINRIVGLGAQGFEDELAAKDWLVSG